jgi:hypothetical protein
MAVTFSGGGEPLLNPDFEKIAEGSVLKGLSLGLVTNGIAMKEWPPQVYKLFKWIRISFDGARETLPDLYSPEVFRVAYSFVFREGDEKNANLMRLLGMAKLGLIHHLRIVSDILDKDAGTALKVTLGSSALPPNVIVQDRSHPEPGRTKCWLPLLKPVVDCDGRVYTCCGAQYALASKENRRGLPHPLCIGNSTQEYIYNHINQDPQVPFGGQICSTCFYGGYNRLLAKIRRLEELEYKWFV